MKKIVSAFILLLVALLVSCTFNQTDVIKDPVNTPNSTAKVESPEVVDVIGNFEVHFIDVGQADSILIKNKEDVMLIDAGNNKDSDLIQTYLKEQNVSKINYLIGTHPHEDHIGSLDTVINNFDVEKIIMPPKASNTKTFEDVIVAIENKKLKITEPKVGDKYLLGDAEFTVLAPAKDYGEELNNASVAIKMVYGNTSFIFAGDAEVDSEKDMLKSGIELKADVLKFGHHGSSTSSSEEFLDAVSPKYGVIMCETGNDYGHPHKETLEKIKNNGIELYRTDKQGTIIAISDGKQITWETALENTPETLTENKAETNNKDLGKINEYVLNTNSKKFHYPTCSGAKSISEKNREEGGFTREELINSGYSPCGTCKP